MLFNKSPDNLFAAVFNIPQGATMTVTISMFMGQMELAGLLKTFMCAYCAGVMITVFLRIPAFGEWVAKILNCGNPKVKYLVSNLSSGALAGVFMNFFMTFMNLGPVSYFPAAFLHTLPLSVVISAVSSTVWIGLTGLVVGKVYGGKAV